MLFLFPSLIFFGSPLFSLAGRSPFLDASSTGFLPPSSSLRCLFGDFLRELALGLRVCSPSFLSGILDRKFSCCPERAPEPSIFLKKSRLLFYVPLPSYPLFPQQKVWLDFPPFLREILLLWSEVNCVFFWFFSFLLSPFFLVFWGFSPFIVKHILHLHFFFVCCPGQCHSPRILALSTLIFYSDVPLGPFFRLSRKAVICFARRNRLRTSFSYIFFSKPL